VTWETNAQKVDVEVAKLRLEMRPNLALVERKLTIACSVVS
jgi:hypothetical protein